ncbi:MAG: glutamate--cysteine ligase, partial [Woeseia sp.]
AFLIYCMLEDSPLLDDDGWDEFAANHTATAKRGRDPDLRLRRDGEEIALAEWANEILPKVQEVAALLDQSGGSDDYSQAVAAQQALVDDPDRTPSARLLYELTSSGSSFFEYAMEAAKGHRDYFAALAPLAEDREKLFAAEAAESLERQREIEASSTESLDDYLAAYFAPSNAQN